MKPSFTVSRESDWSGILHAARGVSHRSTTSSRRPGKAIEGTVSYEVGSIVRCPDCGFMRRAHPGPHAPRLTADNRRVDCAGREVAP